MRRLQLKISVRIIDHPHCSGALFWARQAPSTLDRGQLTFSPHCHSKCPPSEDAWRPGDQITLSISPIFHHLDSGPSKAKSVSVVTGPAQASSIQIPFGV